MQIQKCNEHIIKRKIVCYLKTPLVFTLIYNEENKML